jgi:hypothetical protein
MAATIVGPVNNISPGLAGGISAANNITGTQAIKNTAGVCVKLSCVTAGSLTLNDASGLVTSQTITGITQAAQAVVTVSTGGASNPFVIGNSITFASVVGMTQINGLVGTVTTIGGVTTAWTITVNINSTAFTAYASGGTAASFGASNEFFSGSLTAGQVVELNWPCGSGIAVTALTSFVGSLAFS